MLISNEDFKEIERWLLNQQFLPQNLDKSFIGTFLLGCDGDLEKTKMVICNYFFARQSVPEIFTNRDPLLRDNVLAWKSSYFIPLTSLQNGCRVFVGACTNADTFDFVKYAKQIFSCFDLLIKTGAWGNGERILVTSYENHKLHNLQSYTLYLTRKVAECGQDKYLPGKLRMIHNVFLPPYMKKIHERFRPHLSTVDERQIIDHKNLKSLHRYINPKILPVEYGGTAGHVDKLVENWRQFLVNNRKFFIEEEEKRMLETRVKFGVREKTRKQEGC